MADGGGKMAEGLPKEVHVGAFLKSRIKVKKARGKKVLSAEVLTRK